MRVWTAALFLGLASLLAGACGSGIENDPILRLSAEEAYEQGKRLMEEKKWFRAREYLLHAFEVEPNSATGREALLLVADSHYLDGGSDNLIKAESRYRDFQNRFPTSTKADYVQFQIANSLARRMRRPDRDQASSFAALESYNNLIQLYPTSDYIDDARVQIALVENNLAKSEYLKGYFYSRSIRLPEAAIERFELVLEQYPGFEEMDKVLFHLGRAYARMDETEKARDAWERLRTDYPDSPLARKIPNLAEEKG